MDANPITAIVTAVATAGSSTTIATVAILQTNKGMDDITARLDRWIAGFESVEQHLGVFVVDIAAERAHGPGLTCFQLVWS
ncbi:MAG: hypothetical protein ACR2JB_30720 [Bryobacteraceae bacterium]